MNLTLQKSILSLYITCMVLSSVYARSVNGNSVYTQRPDDPEALYFTPENFNIKADGKTDVSDALQEAIIRVKREKNFGILFIPEGKYLISRTIQVPSAIRLIGYGAKRPEIILGPNTPGYSDNQNYMIWFTGGLAQPGREPQDAGAGTFYSALSNINIRIGKGNPQAVAIRSHFAQHSFINHCDIYIGDGKAGIYDVGNEIENIRFYGGQYGITSNRTSPGWPMMMMDTYFEGQRKAAILTREVGFAIVNMHVKNAPVAVEMQANRVDRLHIENSYFENVSRAGVVVSIENNAFSQFNMLNVYCKNVPVLVHYLQSGRKTEVGDAQYHVKDYTYGLVKTDMTSPSDYKTISDIVPLARFMPPKTNDIPALPAMETWVNIRDLGAKGDGETDDTEVFRNAIARHKHIYVPQGWYRITGTVKMAAGTKLIGLHPFATQLMLKESEPAFSGFGAPVAVIESSEGGDDVLNGIGINTGGYNYRATGCKWMAGQLSYMNDVKFVGGHGTMRKPTPGQEPQQYNRARTPSVSSPTNPVAAQGLDLAWDNQYWSLWITRGGGTFKDIWTANTYAASGMFVSNTAIPSRVYAVSLEHHVRNEAHFENVSNWKIYAFQFEEEGREGKDCKMLEISNCTNLMFVNVWMYRVIRASTPQEFGVRLWNSRDITFRNMHNYTQVLPVIEIPVYDVNRQIPVYEWDVARLYVSGDESGKRPFDSRPGVVNRLAEGFEFAAGIATDSKGNAYFCENRLRKVYKWDTQTRRLSLLSAFPWKPFALATDTDDNLLVVFRYDPQPGYLVDGVQETVPRLSDDNPMYSSWGNSGWAAHAYAVHPDNPAETLRPLNRQATADVHGVRKVIWPASRWRANFDSIVVNMPAYSFVAPDGATIIPETYDLGRSAALISVAPGQTAPAFVANENNKTTLRFDVAANGALANPAFVSPHGQYSTAIDRDGNLYVADGEIFVYDKSGRQTRRIQLDERPISIAIGGAERKTLFVTTTKSFLCIFSE